MTPSAYFSGIIPSRGGKKNPAQMPSLSVDATLCTTASCLLLPEGERNVVKTSDKLTELRFLILVSVLLALFK